MDRNRINFWVDVAAFVVFLVLVFTGFILHLHPSGGGAGSVLDISGQDWKGIHMLSAMLFLVLIIVHLVLHRSWGGACGKRYTGIGPWILGTIVGVLLLASVFVPFMLVGDRTGAGGGGYRGGRGEGYGIESSLSGVTPGSGPGRSAGDGKADIDTTSPDTAGGGGGGGNRWGQNR